MISSISDTRVSNTAGFMETGAAQRPQIHDSFEQQLYEALANSLSRLGQAGSQIVVNVEEARQENASANSPRQFLITVSHAAGAQPPPSAEHTPVPAPELTKITRAEDYPLNTSIDRLPAIASNNLSVRDYANPLPALMDALKALGIDTSGMTFELIDDVVGNIGGHYTNHSIRADLGNGAREDFSVEWTLRNPKVTAVEIARLKEIRLHS